MNLSTTAEPSGPDWVPVDACTLPTAEQPLRVAEWDHLFTSVRAVERPSGSATRARLILAGDEELATRTQQLADAETACCSFWTFTVTSPGGGTDVALDIEVPEAHADVLAALVGRAAR
jgi:hypothetical protein